MINRANLSMGVLLALVGITNCVPLAAAAPEYSATASVTYSFVDISATGTGVLSGTDDGKVAVAIGFPFSFYGQNYSTACVSTNGLLSFGACDASIDFNNQDLSSAATPGNLPGVAPFWTDLTFAAAGSGAVQYQTMGDAGSRQFIVQWTNAYVVRAKAPVTFQVILSEGSNNILVQYKNVEVGAGSPANEGGKSTVGIRDTDGQTSGRYLQWSYNAPVLTNSAALLFRPAQVSTTVEITVTTAPAGLEIKVDRHTYTSPKTFRWETGSKHTLSVEPHQNGPGIRAEFVSWSNGGQRTQSVTTPASATTFTALFHAEYRLKTQAHPGGGGTITDGGYFDAGTSVVIQATPRPGYTFVGFSGDLAGTNNPQTLVMNGPKDVEANFDKRSHH